MPLRLFALAVMLSVPAGAQVAAPSASLKVEVEGLRDHNGALMYCLTRRTAEFLACDKDPAAVRRIALAGGEAILFDKLEPGDYALLVMHDANRNGKLDKRLGIPREGFGFSGNPAIRFGPPSAREVRFTLLAGAARHSVKMRYIF